MDDKIMKQLKESWEQLEKPMEEDYTDDDGPSEILWQLNRIGFKKEKLNWMLNKVQEELKKEKEKTRNSRHNSSLEVILTDVSNLILEILNS